MKSLSNYLQFFSKLRRDYKNGGAPHKPILLLAVLDLVGKGEITNNRIVISPELVLTFKTIWSKLVITKHVSNFSLPFYHMKSEPFWKLVSNAGMDVPVSSSNSVKSFKGLKESVAFAEIDKDLFLLMQDSINRAVFTETLLEQYFPETKDQLFANSFDLFTELEMQMIADKPDVYQERIEDLKSSLSKDEFAEEIFIRGGVFKREIPKLYDYQCAISGMRIESLSNAQMIDACHIVPFAFSKDDTITNGISLSPNLHRAFDRGLITITENYIVRVSPTITEFDSPYSIKQFEGVQIKLPQNIHHYPSPSNLTWHKKETFIL